MALCFAVFCPSYVFAQAEAIEGHYASGSDAFASGATWSSRTPSPLEMRRIRTQYYHEESSLPVSGDIFAGYGPNLVDDLDLSLFSIAGKNDPFASGVPSKEDTYAYRPPFSGEDYYWGGNTGSQGASDVFSSGDTFSRGIRLRGRTNGTIGPQRGSRKQFVAFGSKGAPPLSGRTWGGVEPKPRNSAPHWETGRLPLKVYISGTVEYARNGLVRNEIKSAFRAWNDASGGKLNYVITSRYVEADIYFVCQQTADGDWAENITDFHNDMFDRVKVCFLQNTLLKLEPKRVKALCLHEIGHALGIMRHSSNTQDVMSLSVTDDVHPITVLTKGDKKLISALCD